MIVWRIAKPEWEKEKISCICEAVNLKKPTIHSSSGMENKKDI